MAITSYGYPVAGGVIMPGSVWANVQKLLGRQLAVPHDTDWKPTLNTGAARTVRLAAGELGGGGIFNVSDAPIDVALPVVSSGSQYFLITGKQTWGATNATVAAYVAGTSARAIPSYTNDPGTLQHLPVALARVSAGNTSLTELVDLRCIAEESGVYTIYDDLALQLIERLGVTAFNKNTGITYRRVLGPGSAGAQWQRVWDAPNGERPTFYIGQGTPSYRTGARNDRLGWGTSVSELNVQKTTDADSVFTYAPAPFGAVGTRLVTKVAGVYSLWGNCTVSQNGSFVSAFLWGSTYGSPAGGLPGSSLSSDASVTGSSAADGPGDAVRRYALETVRYLKAGATISLSLETSATTIIEAWQMWAQRLSD